MLHVLPSNSKRLLDFSHPLVSRRWFSNGHSHQTPIQPIKYNGVLDYLDNLLGRCTNFQQSRQIHAQIVLWGGSSTAYLASRLVSVYSRFGLLKDARSVFETVPTECLSNTLVWNSILRANVTNGEHQEAIRVYTRMRNLGSGGDGFSFPLVVRACAMVGHVKLCQSVHCHVLQLGFQDNLHVVNELLLAYGKIGQMDVARQLFDTMTIRSYISWNTMVSSFAINYDCDGAFEIFKRMELDGWEPNLVTWTSLLSSHAKCGFYWETLRLYNVMRRSIGATAASLALVVSVCIDSELFSKVREIHGYVITAGFEDYSFVKNSLVSLYGRHGIIEAAENLFSEITMKSVVSWNALISSYAESGLCDEAYSTFLRLEASDGCVHVRPDVVSWSSIISGFASKRRSKESLELFRKMQHAKVQADPVTVSSILSICADLSTLVLGKEIHAHVIRHLVDSNPSVGNGLINMYAKCGSLKEVHLAVENIHDKDSLSWNTLIKAYGMLGRGDDALRAFNRMINGGCKPDRVTFISLLSACSHAGLVSQGRKLFNEMKTEFGIEPEIEHYACMVDLLGRAGCLEEASDIVKRMPMEPNVCVWGALLNSCRMHKNTDCADESIRQILGCDSATGNYMLLSNIYAASSRWEDSAKVRVSARDRGLKKTPGQSWIELNKTMHMFTAGDLVKSGMEKVQRMLEILSFQMEMDDHV